MGNISDILVSAIGRSLIIGREDDRFLGYDLAANICIDVIDKRIGELNERMSAGRYLKNEEQLLLGQLNMIRCEVERELSNGVRDIEIHVGESRHLE